MSRKLTQKMMGKVNLRQQNNLSAFWSISEIKEMRICANSCLKERTISVNPQNQRKNKK